MESQLIKVLFVCMGNICRSPTAEGVFAQLVKKNNLNNKIHIDSAGTHAYHVGEQPDHRSQEVAKKRGIDLSGLRGRQVISNDIIEFDYVLAMDNENYENLLNICPDGYESRISLFLSHASDLDVDEVPDPYYGGNSGFDYVLDITEEASKGLLYKIRSEKNF